MGSFLPFHTHCNGLLCTVCHKCSCVNNMRLLTFSSKNRGGGSIVKLLELVNGLADRGWHVDFISPKDFKEQKNISHYPIKKIPVSYGFFYLVQITIVSFLIIIKRQKIDRIITFSMLEGIVALLVSIFSKETKVIVSLHGDWYTGIHLSKLNKYSKYLYIKMYLAIERIVFMYSDMILFVSKENYTRINNRTKLDIKKTRIIYNNLNNPRTIKLFESDKIEFKEDKIIGFVGNLYAKEKGIEILIEAFKKVYQKNQNIRLVIVGDGPDKEYLYTLCKTLKIEKNVLFTGYLENPFPYIKAFDIMVLPSLHEGFNLSILEALYCDKVVLGSKVGGVPEALVYDGLLFNPEDIDGLSLKISNIILDKNLYNEYQELCKNRKEAFMFNWVEQMENLILSVN